MGSTMLSRAMTGGLLATLLVALGGCPTAVCREDVVNCVGRCEGGKARSCTDLGSMYETGRGVEQDYARAAELFKKGCEGGDMLGCTYLGGLYETGRGVEEDKPQALVLYQKGCQDGIQLACNGVTRLQ